MSDITSIKPFDKVQCENDHCNNLCYDGEKEWIPSDGGKKGVCPKCQHDVFYTEPDQYATINGRAFHTEIDELSEQYERLKDIIISGRHPGGAEGFLRDLADMRNTAATHLRITYGQDKM